MGTGKAVLDCRLSGDCSIDQGVGALELTLRGTPNDYRIKLDKGIGSARLGGSGVGDGTYGSGACTVDLDGGIGSMTLLRIERFGGFAETVLRLIWRWISLICRACLM